MVVMDDSQKCCHDPYLCVLLCLCLCAATEFHRIYKTTDSFASSISSNSPLTSPSPPTPTPRTLSPPATLSLILIHPSSSSGSPGRITAEPLMYRAALQLARDASVEELLGNLQTYVRLISPQSLHKTFPTSNPSL